MNLTRLTLCLGFLLALSTVPVLSQETAPPARISGGASSWGASGSTSAFPTPPIGPTVPTSIPKGGAGVWGDDQYIVIYDQGRGQGRIIAKRTTRNGDPVITEFKIR